VKVLNGRLCAEFRVTPTGPLIALVILKSGQVSSPIVVHDENALRRAAPGQIDGRLREAFDHIRKGKEDLLDLAQHAHMIFAPDPAQAAAAHVRRGGSRLQRGDGKAVAYQTPDEFRRAVALEPASGSTGRFSVDDPGLLQVLSIVMRGVGGVGTPEDREILDDQDDADLEAGDSEDDGTQSGEEEECEQAFNFDQQPAAKADHPFGYICWILTDIRTFGMVKIRRRFRRNGGQLRAPVDT
jgi:hypothetical protein